MRCTVVANAKRCRFSVAEQAQGDKKPIFDKDGAVGRAFQADGAIGQVGEVSTERSQGSMTGD